VGILLVPSPHNLYSIFQSLLESLIVRRFLGLFENEEETGDFLLRLLGDWKVSFIEDFEEYLHDSRNVAGIV
jgi:hypothetical protein